MEKTAIVKSDQDRASLTRRSFVKVAVGTIAALPVVSGGLALPFSTPEKAYGLDTVIVSAKSDEAAVVVMDLAGKKHVPLEGAHVKITSNFNNEVAKGTTDKQGKVILNITALAEDSGKTAKPPRYEFDAQVEVTKPGYRVFRTGRMRVQGARGISVPTRKIEADIPYPACVSFDDWDALYTDNEFCVTPKNDMRHTLQVELENLTSNSTVKVALYAGDKEVASATADPYGGKCTALLQEHFLMTGAYRVLPVGASYSISYEQDGQRFMAPLAMKTMAAAGGFEAPGVNRNFTLSPFSELGSGDTHKGLQVTIPKGCPLIGGTSIQFWKPQFNNLDYGFDPFGFAYISVRTSEYGYKSKNGKTEGKAWQAHPKKSFQDQYDKVLGDVATNMLDTLGAMDKWNGLGSNVSFNRLFSATVLGQISLAAKWGEKQENLFRVRFGGQIIFAMNFSLAWQFLAGPVPMVFEFALNTSFAVGLNAAASTTDLFKWPKYQVDYTNSSLSLTIDISPSVSLGVGIKGALSVSVKGVLTVTIMLAMTKLPDNRPKDVENPHKVLGLAASTFVVIQFLFFTIPFKLPFKISEPALYDSWRGGYKPDYAPTALSTQADDDTSVSFEELLIQAFESGEAYFLTDEDFEACIEQEYGDNGVYDYDIDESSGEDEEFADGYDKFSTEYEIAEEELDNGEYLITLKRIESDVETMSAGMNATAASDSNGASTARLTMLAPESLFTSSLSGQAAGSLAAGSSPDLAKAKLSAQTAPPPVPDCTVTDERVYVNKGDSVVEQRVSGHFGKNGLMPRVTEIFAKNALGDPHIKTISLFGKEFIFRIGSVQVRQGGKTHTVARILGEGSLGSNQRYNFVFDYDPRGVNIRRHEFFDYNYDVYAKENGDAVDLHFFIVSGKRTVSDQNLAALAYAAKDQVATYVHYKLDKSTKKATLVKTLGYLTSGPLFNAAGVPDNSKDVYHNFSCPQIQYVQDSIVRGGEKVTRGAYVMSYLDRASTDPKKIFSQKKSEVYVGFGLFCYDPTHDSFIACSTAEINQTVFGEHKDYSVFETNLFHRCKTIAGAGEGWHVAMVKGGTYTYYFLVELGALSMFDINKNDYLAGAIRKPKLFAVHDPDQEKTGDFGSFNFFGPSRLIEWPNHEGYLASVKGKLVHVTLTNLVRPADEENIFRVPGPRFAFAECGPQNFSVTSFGVDESGNFLYYPAVREGVPGFSMDEKGNSKADKAIEEHDVMVCKLYGDKFSDPFVFCEVEYDMDTLVALCPQKSIAMSFLSTNLTDTKRGRAEIRYTAMPYVRCANVIGFQSLSEYAFPGVPALFNVTIRNDGNVHLAGCSIRLHRRANYDNSRDTVTKLVFSKETLRESNFNIRQADGTLSDVAPDYSLAPGKTSVYQVELMIPSNWNGTTWASVTAQDFVTAKGSGGALDTQSADGLSTQDADDTAYVDYIVADEYYQDDDNVAYPYDNVEVWYSDEVTGSELVDAPVQGDEPDGKRGNGGTAEGGSKGTQDDKKATASESKLANTGSRETTPKTGDSAGGMGIAALAAVGAGAALAAYSRRRVQNEREAAGNAEDEV